MAGAGKGLLHRQGEEARLISASFVRRSYERSELVVLGVRLAVSFDE
jgi:hypothetical protein